MAEFTTLVGIVAWPLVIVFLLVAFRDPLIDLVNNLAARTRSISVSGFGLELTPLSELQANWDVPRGSITEDVRQLSSSQIFDSYSTSLFNELTSSRDAEYAVIDLGTGRKWLTSRLFIFSLVLSQASKIRAFVFVEKTQISRQTFLGIANPNEVRQILANHYAWLDPAFAKSYAGTYGDADILGQRKDYIIPFIFARAQIGYLMTLVRSFVDAIQSKQKPKVGEESFEQFRMLDEQDKEVDRWERTRWIDSDLFDDLFGRVVRTDRFYDSPDLSRQARADGILRRPGPLVALVDEYNRFLGLVDQCSLVRDDRQDRARSTDRAQ